MQVIILFSDNRDLIESMKQAITYKHHANIKFHFYTELALVQAHFRNIGLPDLLLYEQKMAPLLEQLPENLSTAQLSERHTTSEKEVFIYQQMDNFIIDVIKTLNQFEERTVLNIDQPNQPNSPYSKLWLIDPCESNWSKQCFAALERKFYGLGSAMISMDASIFGAKHADLSQANMDSLSRHIATYVWDKSNYGEMLLRMQSGKTVHMIHGVNHPMDLLSLDAGFWEAYHGAFTKIPMNHLLYSGLLSEPQLKALCSRYDKLLLISQDSSVSKEKLEQIASWFVQVAPKLKIKICPVASQTATPEQYIESIWQWIIQRREG